VGHLLQTIGYAVLALLGLLVTINWISDIVKRFKKKEAESDFTPGSMIKTGVVEIKFLRRPIIIRILIIVLLMSLLVVGFFLIEELYMSAVISEDFANQLDVAIGLGFGLVIAYAMFFELPKLFGFKRLRFDFDTGTFTRFDYPKMKVRGILKRVHMQAEIRKIHKAEDMGNKIRVTLSEHDPEMMHDSFFVRTRNLTWSHEEILKLLTDIANNNLNSRFAGGR